MEQTEKQIAAYLSLFGEDIRTLAGDLRRYLKETTRPTIELVADSTNSLNIGYGFTEKAWDCFCAIIIYRKHINISFPSGAALSDVHKLLHGTGKRVRHLKLKSLEDVSSPEVLGLLLQARDQAREAVPAQVAKEEGVRTIIKHIAGIKKRPAP